MNMTNYPLEITVKSRGFYNRLGDKRVCFLTSGMKLPARRMDDGDYAAYVERNGWNEETHATVLVEAENVSSHQRRATT